MSTRKCADVNNDFSAVPVAIKIRHRRHEGQLGNRFWDDNKRPPNAKLDKVFEEFFN